MPNIAETTSHILSEIGRTIPFGDTVELDRLIDELTRPRRIFCLGAGRSRMVLESFCMRLNHLGLGAYMAGGLPCPPVSVGDLVLVMSGSGQSPSVRAQMEKARSLGAVLALVTASAASATELGADIVIRVSAPSDLVHVGHPASGQPMRSLFEQSVFITFEALVLCLKVELGQDDLTMAERHANME